MKRILIGGFILCFLALARAQDDATQQQLNKLSGQIQDLTDAQALQTKRLEALEKEIGDLRDKSSTGPSVSPDDLQKLADQVQEIDKKRQADKELILKEIEKLGKVSGGASGSGRKTSVPVTPLDAGATAASGPQKGYDYTIQRGDTLMAIAKAYRDQGIKVTTDQILKANPGLDPKSLIVGKKIFIPAPAQ